MNDKTDTNNDDEKEEIKNKGVVIGDDNTTKDYHEKDNVLLIMKVRLKDDND